MKKIFMVLVACGAMAATLNSCNDAEANKKAEEADNVLVQEQVTAKVTELTDAATAACDAAVLTEAQAEVTRLAEEAAKTPGKKPVVKAKPKPVVKKEEPKKPETVGNGKPKIGGDKDPNTVGDGKPKMGGDQKPNTVGSGKPKMGGN